MTNIFSAVAGNSADPVCWQCHASFLSDGLIITCIATAVIWLVLCLACLVLDRPGIVRSLTNLIVSHPLSPRKIFFLFINTRPGRSERRQQKAA